MNARTWNLNATATLNETRRTLDRLRRENTALSLLNYLQDNVEGAAPYTVAFDALAVADALGLDAIALAATVRRLGPAATLADGSLVFHIRPW